MKSIYASPLRVYLSLALLAFAGLICASGLPVSLFPNTSKPVITLYIPYGSSTPTEFLTAHGHYIESKLQLISTEAVEVEKTRATYEQSGVRYEVEFRWGAPPRTALKEVETLASSLTSRFPEEVRNSVQVEPKDENGGFIAVSFFSPTRSLDDLHEMLEPIILPRVTQVRDASRPMLWNPSLKEIRIELNPERMASFQLLPKDIDQAVLGAINGYSGGSTTIGTQQLAIQMPRAIFSLDDVGQILVPTPSGQAIHLSDVAKADFALNTMSAMTFKTSGTPCLILFAQPRPGGNVKKMSEDIIQIVKETMPVLPSDVQYKVLVDPSEFIRSAVDNVFHEVAIGAFLAVLVLFLFIGSFKNTVTAAIEIPLSMILAFILMKLTGMNLNLISLGGLALSAGMNVDASVVVMENIFRHFEEVPKELKAGMDFNAKLKLITQAVAEVRFSVIASTIASLVVFVPLAFTSDLSYAVLGDLAKTVVFSHGFSAFIALILVPTVRLQLMSKQSEHSIRSPIEGTLARIENFYVSALHFFIRNRRFQRLTYLGLIVLLPLLVVVILPRLPTEVVGKPDTDWIDMVITTKGNTLLKQMEAQTEEIEAKLLARYGSKFQYTFTRVWDVNQSSVMARLVDKAEMNSLWKSFEAEYKNTALFNFKIDPWNPAELPIPDPPQMKIAVRGGKIRERAQVTQQIFALMEESQVFPQIWVEPYIHRSESIMLMPRYEQWSQGSQGYMTGSPRLPFYPADLADLARVATTGRRIGQLSLNGRSTDVFMRFPENTIHSAEDLGAMPIGIGNKIIPLKALTDVRVEEAPPLIYHEDQAELFTVLGQKNRSDKNKSSDVQMAKARALVQDWTKKNGPPRGGETAPSITFEDAEKEIHQALNQLSLALGLSILLIFITLVVQFGDLMNALLVLVAVPLGFIGVLISLFVFRSTLSLNSALGVILLNGIAVANSIILVDFLRRQVELGMEPLEAALVAAKKRLRPILITSLTTILGMLPIAFGFGEGGRILQPLGIAVSGGLWVSMGLTLFIVPTLQVSYLTWKNRQQVKIAPVQSGELGGELLNAD